MTPGLLARVRDWRPTTLISIVLSPWLGAFVCLFILLTLDPKVESEWSGTLVVIDLVLLVGSSILAVVWLWTKRQVGTLHPGKLLVGMRALRILHVTWASFLVLVCARPWFLGHLHPASKMTEVFILAQMLAALGIVRNIRVAWWACLVCSGFWFLISLLFFVTLPVLFITHPERPWANSWVPLGHFILVTFVPSVLSLWLYFRRRGEMFSSMLMPESPRAA